MSTRYLGEFINVQSNVFYRKKYNKLNDYSYIPYVKYLYIPLKETEFEYLKREIFCSIFGIRKVSNIWMFWISRIATAQAFQLVQVVFNFQKPRHLIFRNILQLRLFAHLDFPYLLTFYFLIILEISFTCRIYYV